MPTLENLPANEFPDWCVVEACTAPIINGVPLCSHAQDSTREVI